MDFPIKCALIIVNYNTRKEIERLLESLDGPGLVDNVDIDFVVIDNASPDDSQEFLQALLSANSTLLSGRKCFLSRENMGFSRAINWGAGLFPDVDYIAALNADVWLTKQDVADVINHMEMHPDIAVSSPKQRNEKGSIVHAGILGTNDAPKHRAWMVPDPEDKLYKDVIDCVTVSGSAYFMRRSIWDETIEYPPLQKFYLQEFDRLPRGGFLETPHYWEETFYSYLVRHLGYRVVYNGEVSIGHSWHASSEIGTGHDLPENVAKSRALFRRACDYIGIERD